MKAEWTNKDSLSIESTGQKAILVIDKPESCTSCLLGIYNKKWFCLKTLKDIDTTDRYHIPKWCPLKPIPQKKELKGGWYHPADVWMEGANFGWNACLDALGETE